MLNVNFVHIKQNYFYLFLLLLKMWLLELTNIMSHIIFLLDSVGLELLTHFQPEVQVVQEL